MRRKITLLLVLGLGALAPFAQAAPDPLDACSAEKDDAARLACFDRQMAVRHAEHPAAASQATTAPAKAAAPGAAAGHPQAPPPEAAAARSQAPAAPQPAAAQVQAPQPSKVRREGTLPVTATVAQLIRLSGSNLAYQLDNGQTWEQTDGRPGLMAKVNDAVTISPGGFGDFFLTTPERQRIRVKRIR